MCLLKLLSVIECYLSVNSAAMNLQTVMIERWTKYYRESSGIYKGFAQTILTFVRFIITE